MNTIELRIGKRPVLFDVADTLKYPTWRTPAAYQVTDLGDDKWRADLVIRQGVRYGNNPLRNRVLAEARKRYPGTPDNASIVFDLTVGFDYKVTEFDAHRETSVSCPELWFALGGHRAYWKAYKSPNKSRLQKFLDSHTFGLAYEDRIAECFEPHQSEGNTDIEVGGLPDFENIDSYLGRILNALADPPTEAPAFPTKFQSATIAKFRPTQQDVHDFEHITSEAMEVMAALGLEPDDKSLQWDTYPPAMACTLGVSTLAGVIEGAMSDKVDEFVAQNTHFADVVADYRKELLTPKTMLLLCVPLYAAAFQFVDVTMKPSRNRGVGMTYEHEATYDMDAMLEEEGAEAQAEQVGDAIQSIMADVDDAVSGLLKGYAKQIEEHSDYLNSDAGIWECIEGCGDFDEDFSRFINHD